MEAQIMRNTSKIYRFGNQKNGKSKPETASHRLHFFTVNQLHFQLSDGKNIFGNQEGCI
jgi:hypothetical protein